MSEIQIILKTELEKVFSRDPLLKDLLEMTAGLGRAKFSRAELLIKIADDNKIDRKDSIQASMAIEMVHLATLVHDDVIDKSDLRRGRANLRAHYGDKSAILFGDYLFSLAVNTIQESSQMNLARCFTRAVMNTCRGESIQDLLLTQKDAKPNKSLFYEICEGKTASLFSFCTEASMWMSDKFDQKDAETMGLVGRKAGLAYQLADDILDITGEIDNLGKPPGNDLLKNTMTLPLYMLMLELDLSWEDLRKRFKEDVNELSRVFLESRSFADLKTEVEEIGFLVQNKSDELEGKGIVIRQTMDFFWQNYVAKRISALQDTLPTAQN